MAPEPDSPREMGVETDPRVIEPESRPPATRSLAAWWIVAAVGSIGLVLLALGHLRWSVVALAISLWIGAATRAVVPDQRAGGLVVRSRAFDVIALVLLGAAVLTVGLTLRRT